MQYFDKNGKETKACMKILMEDGSIELVYATDDAYGNPDLGTNASNEAFLREQAKNLNQEELAFRVGIF